ncbi:hypothetical protein AcW1_001562 [Taiwanofungus camphoratus]|nr:hypothetical protein AcW1_001562 [Antrodia cinnamomea]
MFDESEPPSPSSALVALAPLDQEWQPILHVSNQVVLYNPTSHALSVRIRSRSPSPSLTRRHVVGRCPYCNRFLPTDLHGEHEVDDDTDGEFLHDGHGIPRSRATNYFQLLEIANETASRPATPSTSTSRASRNIGGSASNASAGSGAFRADNMAEGYFKAFFKEEGKLGMGANGSVFLCQHLLDGNPLGHFAVKKIAVGQSHSYLLDILREVRLLERLHHPNIVTYHHAWLETCQFSSFGPKVPTLHVLMQWAEGGSLDDLIDTRLGRRVSTQLPHLQASKPTMSPSNSVSASPQSDALDTPAPAAYSRTARIRAFRALQRAPPGERERLRRELGLGGVIGDGASARGPADWKAVHLLSAEEVRGLFGDVVSGLAFLHNKSILHLDLKPGNVLLTWDEGRLIPRAMLSDFGTSQDMLKSRTRSGNTGTLEYSSPESLPSPTTGQLRQVDSKADMWSVGMILHKLLFFRLPYRHASDGTANERKDEPEAADVLEKEVLTYSGFKSSPVMVTAFESRHLPRAYLVLLEGLLNITPSTRPSCERVLSAIREGKLDPLSPDSSDAPVSRMSLIPLQLRRSFDAAAASLLPRVITSDDEHDLYARVSQELESSVGPDSSPAPLDEKRKETVPFLGFQASPLSFSTNGAWARTIQIGGRQIHIRIPRVMWMRTLKSCILVTKVLSISRVCPGAGPHPIVTSLAVILAVTDTWFDGINMMLVLGVLHAALLCFGCWGRGCM